MSKTPRLHADLIALVGADLAEWFFARHHGQRIKSDAIARSRIAEASRLLDQMPRSEAVSALRKRFGISRASGYRLCDAARPASQNRALRETTPGQDATINDEGTP